MVQKWKAEIAWRAVREKQWADCTGDKSGRETDNKSVPVGLEEEAKGKLGESERVAVLRRFGSCQAFSQSICQIVWQKANGGGRGCFRARGLDLQRTGVVKWWLQRYLSPLHQLRCFKQQSKGVPGKRISPGLIPPEGSGLWLAGDARSVLSCTTCMTGTERRPVKRQPMLVKTDFFHSLLVQKHIFFFERPPAHWCSSPLRFVLVRPMTGTPLTVETDAEKDTQDWKRRKSSVKQWPLNCLQPCRLNNISGTEGR